MLELNALAASAEEAFIPACRACNAHLTAIFADLGMQPLANSYLPSTSAIADEEILPLRVRVCGRCFLVQTDETPAPEKIFRHYAYFSSHSTSWLRHAEDYAQAMVSRFGLNRNSLAVEVASNDGYLLQYFQKLGVSVLGVEPAANVAEHARRKGIATEVAFFGSETARRLKSQGLCANLMTANNVLAHVPDIRDFLSGFRVLLKEEGAITFEFPHLLNLIALNQFDTIYHEHYSYLSLLAVEKLLAGAGLRAFDVEMLPTHGGSLRLFACHEGAGFEETSALLALRRKEHDAGLHRIETYTGYQSRADAVRTSFLSFLDKVKKSGKTICAYGAAAKGNTFLNFCGVTAEDILLAADKNPEKQNTLLPGSHIPVTTPEALIAAKPDYVLILPWNLAAEIRGQLAIIEQRGGRFVVAIPETVILS